MTPAGPGTQPRILAPASKRRSNIRHRSRGDIPISSMSERRWFWSVND